MTLVIALLWILLAIVLITGVFLAILWILRYVGLPIPPQVDKFGLAVIAILALIWLLEALITGSVNMPFHTFGPTLR